MTNEPKDITISGDEFKGMVNALMEMPAKFSLGLLQFLDRKQGEAQATPQSTAQ